MIRPIVRISAAAAVFFALAPAVPAHIDLLSPKPLLHGKAMDMTALKAPPFGAPGVDAGAAPVAATAAAGGTIDVEINMYVYHPGEVVFQWTRDPDGADIEPVWSIPGEGAEIPHANLLHSVPVPGRDEDPLIRTSVPLPDVEGEIYLVVRQVMHDKMDALPDGSISLARVYYHQAAKLNLVRMAD